MKLAVNARGRRGEASLECAERESGASVALGVLPGLLGYNLRRAHQCAWRHYVAAIGEGVLRPGLFSLLVLAHENPGIAQVDLGRHLGVDKASMVALLDRLERAALIERRRSTRDRRCQGIFLTAAGAVTLQRMMPAVRQLEKQLIGRYSKSELEVFIGYLQRMYC
jgi:DNA-binding MarR family transcriptional regulator